MKNILLKKSKLIVLGILLFCQITVSMASISNDPFEAAQSAGFNNYSFGGASVGGKYDTLLGMILNAHYTHEVNESFAFGAIGEYGPNQTRLNGTIAHTLWKDGQIKLSSEYLSQNLPFEFDSGDINQRVHQTAYGFELQQALHQNTFQDVSLGGYRSQAPNVSLSDVTFVDDDLYYTNQRNIAGAVSRGANIGTDLHLTSSTALNVKLNYDDVQYNTDLTGDTSYNNARFGFSTTLEQIVTDRIKFSLHSEERAIGDNYRAEISLAPALAQPLGMRFCLFVERLISNSSEPNSNSVGLNVTLLSEDDTRSPDYHLAHPDITQSLADWAKSPAVYMDRVLAVAEQKTTLNAPTSTGLSPNTGSFAGGNIITMTGSNFLSGITATFSGTPATVTRDSSSKLSIVVPAYVSSSKLQDTVTTPVDVVITNPDGQQTVYENAYTYTTAFNPTLNSLSPNTGSITGNETITFTGTQLSNTTKITFDGIDATSINNVSNTSVTAMTPAHGTGSVDVILTTNEGNTKLTNGFTYYAAPSVTSISPNIGSTSGNDSVTINGSGFTGATEVNFGETEAQYTLNSDSSITATSPSHAAGEVNITVTTAGGTSSATTENQFTYSSSPIISSVSPNTASPYDFQTNVTFTGSSLSDTTSGNVTCTNGAFVQLNNVQVQSDTTVNATMTNFFGGQSSSLSNRSPLLRSSPLRTVLATFAAHGSSHSKAMC